MATDLGTTACGLPLGYASLNIAYGHHLPIIEINQLVR